jgi:hypothetical protein
MFFGESHGAQRCQPLSLLYRAGLVRRNLGLFVV